MFRILTHNQISVKGLNRFSREKYEVASSLGEPDAIMLRSHVLCASDVGPSVKAIGRAGAGVNNIPVDICAEKGIPVFNAPGANSNAVKELVLAGMLLSSRGILKGIDFVAGLDQIKDADEMHRLLEKEKKIFAGNELAGKTLGVVGLGAIGAQVAQAGAMMGMKVLGYDPALSVDAAWRLSSDIERMENLQSLLSKSDYISLHLPVLDVTRHMINDNSLRALKPGARLLNFARDAIVDTEALIRALDSGKMDRYVTDFPEPLLIGREDVILMPHIGASTGEAEENCAIMVADQLTDFLENGNIRNSVNFPQLFLERSEGSRIAIANRNVPKILGGILSVLADRNINVIDMLNKSRGDQAYNLIDVETQPDAELKAALEALEGVVNVRIL